MKPTLFICIVSLSLFSCNKEDVEKVEKVEINVIEEKEERSDVREALNEELDALEEDLKDRIANPPPIN